MKRNRCRLRLLGRLVFGSLISPRDVPVLLLHPTSFTYLSTRWAVISMWEFVVADPFEFAGERIALSLTAVDEQVSAALFSIESPEVLGSAYQFLVLEGSRIPLIVRSLDIDSVECGACPLRDDALERSAKWGAEKWRGGLFLRGTLIADRTVSRR